MNNIRTLDLNLLKVMDALLDECNVTRAAQKLSLTQPSVSIMLNRLRDNFKDPLFVRGSHGMVPTDRALALADPIKKILREIMVLVQPVDFNPAELEFTLKIAANDNDMSIIGVPFLLELKKQAPRVKIAFFSYHKLNVQLLLERGELDLILIDPENSPPSLYHRVLFKERYMCVMRKGHLAAKLKKLTLEEFCSWEHVLVSHHGGQFHGVTDDALEKVGLKRNVALSITSFLVLPSILEKSDFIAVAPEPVVRDLKDMVLKEPPIAVQGFSKIVAWHERNHRDPVQQWIRNLMFTTCNALYN